MSSQIQTDRVKWVDIGRGICIILMVVCHFSNYQQIWFSFNGFTGKFFLVYFFFVAGLFFNHKIPLGEFVKKNAKKIIVPYVFVVLLILGFKCIQKSTDIPTAAISAIFSYSNVIAFGNISTIGIGPIWFLPAFFVSTTLYKLIENRKFRFFYVVVLIAFALISKQYFTLPFAFQSGCIAVLYIWMGDAGRPHIMKAVERLKKFHWSVLALFSLLFYFLTRLVANNIYIVSSGMDSLDLGSTVFSLYSVPESLLGFCLVIIVSLFIEKVPVINDFLAMCGKNSFAILIIHSIDIMIIRNWNNHGVYFLITTVFIYAVLSQMAVKGKHFVIEKSLHKKKLHSHKECEDSIDADSCVETE